MSEARPPTAREAGAALAVVRRGGCSCEAPDPGIEVTDLLGDGAFLAVDVRHGRGCRLLARAERRN